MLLYKIQGVYLPGCTTTLHLLLLKESDIATMLIVCVLEISSNPYNILLLL